MLVETSNRAHVANAAAAQLPKSPKTKAFERVVMYYGYRFYDPETGRWPSRDPIEEEGGLNLYGFLNNDGVNKSDILGLILLSYTERKGTQQYLSPPCPDGWKMGPRNPSYPAIATSKKLISVNYSRLGNLLSLISNTASLMTFDGNWVYTTYEVEAEYTEWHFCTCGDYPNMKIERVSGKVKAIFDETHLENRHIIGPRPSA